MLFSFFLCQVKTSVPYCQPSCDAYLLFFLCMTISVSVNKELKTIHICDFFSSCCSIWTWLYRPVQNCYIYFFLYIRWEIMWFYILYLVILYAYFYDDSKQEWLFSKGDFFSIRNHPNVLYDSALFRWQLNAGDMPNGIYGDISQIILMFIFGSYVLKFDLFVHKIWFCLFVLFSDASCVGDIPQPGCQGVGYCVLLSVFSAISTSQ